MSAVRQLQRVLARTSSRLGSFETYLLTVPLAPYGVAASRILGGLAWVGLLANNFSDRSLLFGPASSWVDSYKPEFAENGWADLVEQMSSPVFTLFYLFVLAAGVAYILGWHTKISGVILLMGAVQIIAANPLVSDAGDNILRIGMLLTLLTDCGAVWSLDARRRRLREDAGTPSSRLAAFGARPEVVTVRTLVHNAAVIALAIQLVVIYIAAGMYKITGTGWRFGTALAYPLRLDEFRVWPALNDLAVASGVVVWAMTYGAILLQLYFPALLLNRVTRRIALVSVLLLHAGIAVLMGLPWFSLAMVAYDGIFVSTATYLLLQRWVVPRWERGREAVAQRVAGRRAVEAS